MSDERNENFGVVSIPVAEYQKLQTEVAHYYGRAEPAEQQAKALQAERDLEAVTRVVRAAAEAARVRAEALPDAVALLAPGLRIENGEVRVKGQPDQNLSACLKGFFQARPHWVQSPKTDAPGWPAVPTTPRTTVGQRYRSSPT
jgi:hypothetical protein